MLNLFPKRRKETPEPTAAAPATDARMGTFYTQSSSWQDDRWNYYAHMMRSPKLQTFAPQSALDVGCRSGRHTHKLNGLFPSLEKTVAVESMAGMFAAAKETADEQTQFYHRPLQALNQLPKKHQHSYDVVQMHFSMHWEKDKKTVFDQLTKFTQPGSLLILGTCQKLPSIFELIDAKIRGHFNVPKRTPSPFYYLDAQEWLTFLKRYGWVPRAIHCEQQSHYTEVTDYFLKHWAASSAERILYGHNFGEIPLDFHRELVEAMLAEYRHEDEDRLLFIEDTLQMVLEKV